MNIKYKFLIICIFLMSLTACSVKKEQTENIPQSTEQIETTEQKENGLKDILESNDEEYHWTAVVMDAKSGEIIDSYGDMDKLYEPGATFRAIPTAILLEKGKLSFSDTFTGDVYINEDNTVIKSHDNQNEEKTFFEHFINLNEPLMIHAWNEKGNDLDLQKEVSTFFTPQEPLTKIDYNLLGRDFHVTAKDMTNAYFYLAGNSKNSITEETAKNMRELLHETYLNYANIETDLATIQNIGEIAGMYASNYYKENEGYYTVSSFTGFAPYDNPDIVMTILMQKQGEMSELSKNKNILADVSTKIFTKYLPKRYFQEITDISQMKNLNNDSEYFIYIGRPTCNPCKRVEPIIRNTTNSLNKIVFYFNTDRFRDSDDLQTVLDTYQIDEVPCMLKIKNGKVLDKILFTGEIDLEKLMDELFL